MSPTKNDLSPLKIQLPEGVTWEEFIAVISRKDNQEFLDSIDPETYKFLLDDKNNHKVKIKILKSLQKTDPANATEKYAEQIITVMKEVAKRHLNIT